MQVLQRHEIEGVDQLDEGRIVAPVVVVLGAAAAAIVDAIDRPRALRVMRQIACEIMEIAAVARKAWQADDGSRLGLWRRIEADMEAQIVEGRVIQVSPQLAVKLGHVVIGA